MKSLATSFALLVGSVQALAAGSNSPNWKGITGVFTDPALWDQPIQAMSKVTLNTSKSGTNVVSLCANWDVPLYGFWLCAPYNGQAVTLDSGDYRLFMPAVGAGTPYADLSYATSGSTFLVKRPGSSCTLFGVNPGDDVSAATAPNFLISNALLTVETSSDGTRNSVDFRRGFYNFYDPEGVVVSTRGVTLFNEAVDVDEALVAFRGRETYARIPKTKMQMQSKNHHFHVTDGACVAMAGFEYGYVNAAGWTGAEILVSGKDSTLRVTERTMFKNPVASPSQERTILKLHDGARLDMAMSEDADSGFDVSNYSSYDFRDSTIFYTNQQSLANQISITQSSSGHGCFYSSNCVWNVGYAANKGNLYLGNGSGAPGSTPQFFAVDSIFNMKSYCVARGNSFARFRRCVFNTPNNDEYAVRTINGGHVSLEDCDIPYGPCVCNNSTVDIIGGHLTNRTSSVQMITINDSDGDYQAVMNIGGECYVHRNVKFNGNSTDERMLGTLNFTGGVIRTAAIYNNRSRVAGYNTRAKFYVNGGVLKPSSEDARLVYQMDDFTVGPRGLTVDSDGMNCRLQASLSNESGQQGLLIKKGAGTLRLVGDQRFSMTGGPAHPERGGDQLFGYNPTKMIIAEGELQLVRAISDDPVEMDTALIVTNGAAVSLLAYDSHNLSSLTVSSLAIDGGILSLDPGDVITVNGDAEFHNLLVRYSEPISAETAQTFLVVRGTISERSVRELARAYWDAAAVPEGKVPELIITETEGGKTFSVKMTTPRVDSLVGERRWTGAVNDDFSTAGNWMGDALPAANECAVFPSDAARRSVSTMAGVASAGGIAFVGEDYVISGENEIRLSGGHAAVIGVSNGVQKVESGLDSEFSVATRVEADALLELSGVQRGGGFIKTGDGSLVLSGENDFVRKADVDAVTVRESIVAVDGGTTVLSNDRALDGLAEVRMGHGTLYVPEENVLTPQPGVKLTTDNLHAEKNFSVLKNDGDVLFASADCSAGGSFGATLVKLGKGDLVIDATDASKINNLPFGIGNMESSGHFLDESKPISFADRIPPEVTDTTYAWGLSMLEGRTMVLGSGLASVVRSKGVCVGLVTRDILAGPYPELVISNVTFDASIDGARPIAIGVQAGVNKNTSKQAKLTVIDADMKTKVLLIGQTWGEVCADDTVIELAVTNSTIRNTYGYLRISGSAARNSKTVVRAEDSVFYGEQWDVMGRNLDADFNNCVLSKNDGASHRAWFRISTTTGNDRMLFRNGAKLEISKFQDANQNHICEALTFAFDGATWDWNAGGNGDFLHCDNNGVTVGTALEIPSLYGQLQVELVDRGLVLPVPEGMTLGCAARMIGSGRLTVSGSGTLRFTAGAPQFSGVATAPDGVLDFSGAGTLTGVGIGSGTTKGASFGFGCYLSPTFSGGEAVAKPHLENCRTTAPLLIDLSGVDKSLLVRGNTFDVATYSGVAPTMSRRIKGVDDVNLRGKYTVADGRIAVTLCDKGDFGLMVIVR